MTARLSELETETADLRAELTEERAKSERLAKEGDNWREEVASRASPVPEASQAAGAAETRGSVAAGVGADACAA